MKKSGWNTMDAIQRFAEMRKVDFAAIGYGGRKDKHALTTQYITVKKTKNPRNKNLNVKGLSIETIGCLKRAMGPDLIAANRFRITIRNIHPEEQDRVGRNIEKISQRGFLNYYDDQRFGPYDAAQGFLAEKIIKKHFNGAVKFLLTRPSSQDKREDLERKKFLFQHWGEWNLCLQKSTTRCEIDTFKHLRIRPQDFIGILRKIPRQELTFHFASYQAFLWNEVLRRLVLAHTSSTSRHKGLTGDYIFCDPAREWMEAHIPTVASKMPAMNQTSAAIFKSLLEEKGLKTPLFNLKKIRQAHFTSTRRPIIALAMDFIGSFAPDDIYPGSTRLRVDFSLSRGAYATMLIKQLFALSE